jgi:hypothetical protein
MPNLSLNNNPLLLQKMKLSNRAIRITILKKMMRHNWWGEKHTAYDNIPRGFPKHGIVLG